MLWSVELVAVDCDGFEARANLKIAIAVHVDGMPNPIETDLPDLGLILPGADDLVQVAVKLGFIRQCPCFRFRAFMTALAHLAREINFGGTFAMRGQPSEGMASSAHLGRLALGCAQLRHFTYAPCFSEMEMRHNRNEQLAPSEKSSLRSSK